MPGDKKQMNGAMRYNGGMAYLVLAILASFSIALLIKHNETHGARTEIVLAGNYLSASAIGWAVLLLRSSGIAIGEISRETWWLGAGGALLWPGAFFLMMWGVRRYGVSLAGSVTRLSLSVPVIFALLFLRERFTPATVLGVAGAFAAFLLLSPFKQARGLDRQAIWYFPALVLIFGVVDLWVNLHHTTAPGGERFLFVVLIFSGAAACAWVAVALRRLRPDAGSVLRGLLLGVPNFFSTYLLMEALRAPVFAGLSAIVYALYSAAGVVLAFMAGAVLWKEPLTGKNKLGVALAVVAVMLLNVR
jgi:drug/metabolite transporter (DMT)-like permease